MPDWIHLIPAGAEIMTQDRRGPYRLDTNSVVASLAPGAKLPIDENHAIDLAGPRGEPSPARGYITELQARADGIWGRVDWTEAGRALMADRAYLGISPAVVHDGEKLIIGLARASLTNKPNLRGLTALHQETSMSLAAVAKALGLSDDAGEDQILGAIGEIKKPSATETALQSSLAEIGVALGVTSAEPEDILAAAKAGKTSKVSEEAFVALQAEAVAISNELNTIKEARARDLATAFVDGAIRDGRWSVKHMRDHYIAMHMQDPARVEKEIGAMPVLNGGVVVPPTPQPANGEVALQSAQIEAAKALGIDPKAYAATLKTETL
ncbi:phage protease [Rhodobacter capsulatus]|uniref:phage protease n=1 Tax=Rhodobacter capsulatus TaxID=1061 RepID=UPI004024D71B